MPSRSGGQLTDDCFRVAGKSLQVSAALSLMCAILFSMRAPILCLLATGLLLGQDPSQTIDKLFERFGLDSPGCAIGIAQNGKALFAKGYGLADLEHNAPLSPSSPFYMASV